MAGEVGKAYANGDDINANNDANNDNTGISHHAITDLLLKMRDGQAACFQRCRVKYGDTPELDKCHLVCMEITNYHMKFLNLIKEHMKK